MACLQAECKGNVFEIIESKISSTAQTWQHNGFRSQLFFLKACWGTSLAFYQSISIKERTVGDAISCWGFSVHGMDVLTTFWLISA